MTDSPPIILQATAVAIEGRALLMEGPPGIGKSSLALALIDRGAVLIGDDGVTLERHGDQAIASPPPNIAGLLEVRGVGLINLPVADPTPVALVLTLGETGERLPDNAPTRDLLGIQVPVLPFLPGEIAPARRAEIALAAHGMRAA
ncbi:HPr kinase/phosphorylase [Erythrobacter rubeus]|uniref:HPr kinase/phosphatase C-terminal domain-containing protein n=1 Tax=Erythrobacter rubeus TaxID=2760803 RepID=A0ABR8KR72_9SPHN|nr:HPr kinase/phosphatase C-terminal domain-containing protein [Erythrobacter rubeus]MBD2842414.1 HPr kinase/phosphatase C-terminal domain-containing protein [Erythrobacter rubeus]